MDVRLDLFQMFHDLKRLTTVGYSLKRYQDLLEKMAFSDGEPDQSLTVLKDKYKILLDEMISVALDLRNKINEN